MTFAVEKAFDIVLDALIEKSKDEIDDIIHTSLLAQIHILTLIIKQLRNISINIINLILLVVTC